MPLIAGRILGWLTIAVPAEQSAGQIADAIGASRASLTTNLRLLSSVGFVTALTRPAPPNAPCTTASTTRHERASCSARWPR